ncbi:MAG: hypothetical protein ACOC2D_13490 [Spirochaetota bacterium]
MDDRVLILTETVSSRDAWEAAYAIALQTDGIVDVELNLAVGSS